MRRSSGVLLLVIGAIALSSRLALASAGQAVAVTGNVIGACNTLSPATATIAFGTYSSFSTADLTAAPVTFSINCTKSDPNFTVSISGGSNYGSASPTGTRAMKEPGGTYLSYQLYQTSDTSAPWAYNTATGSGTAVSETANGLYTASTFSVYGVIPHGQTNAAVSSNFSDSVTVTVNF